VIFTKRKICQRSIEGSEGKTGGGGLVGG